MSECNPNTSETVISIRDVHKRFKNVHAVSGISLAIQRGEYLALLGPNGAGKTTLVEMLEGLQTPDSGQIQVLGKSWKQNEAFLRARLGLSLQETRLVDKLTVQETLFLFASFYRLGKTRALEILHLVDLVEKQKSLVETLSGGQKQKLALGIAIINQPEILILDEPTIGLDPHARREMWEILYALKKRCTTLILTTHYMDEAAYLCNRICIMHKGKILTQGTLESLLSEHAGHEIIEFSLRPGQTPDPLIHLPGVLKSHWDELKCQGTLEVEHSAHFLPAFFEAGKKQQVDILKITARQQTLEDLFITLTGRRLDE